MDNENVHKSNFDQVSKIKQQNTRYPPNSNQFKQRSGLLPTNEHDACRSANRASRRSRAERTSYLMATGHLDPEETEHLNGPIDDTTLSETSNPILSSTSNSANLHRDISDQKQTSHRGLRVSTKRSNFEQSFLDDLNRTLANSPVTNQNLLQQTQHHNFRQGASGSSCKKGGSSRKSKKHPSSKMKGDFQSGDIQNDNNGRGKFRQTYTEVTLPMKTSPAFEYILKDNRRRNKRCCLWFIYATLMTICIIVIIWASIMIGRSAHK